MTRGRGPIAAATDAPGARTSAGWSMTAPPAQPKTPPPAPPARCRPAARSAPIMPTCSWLLRQSAASKPAALPEKYNLSPASSNSKPPRTSPNVRAIMSACSMAPRDTPREENMTTFLTRRTALLAAATCAATLGLAAVAEAQTSIKIGYAISRTGPNTGGAAVTTIPNYELWVKEVNAAGGIKLGDKRVPIEVVQYDD